LAPGAIVGRTERKTGKRMNSSTLTGLAAMLFGCGLVALFAAMFRGGGPLFWIGLGLLAATIVCWFAAAKADAARG
jgi:hypothetical protein